MSKVRCLIYRSDFNNLQTRQKLLKKELTVDINLVIHAGTKYNPI